MNDNVKKYPGGLKVVNPLHEVIVPQIVTKMVNAKLSQKKLVQPGDKEQAEGILRILKSRPKTLEEYVQKQRLYNFMSWMNEQLESERNISEPCLMQSLGGEPCLYRADVQRVFCEKNDVKLSLLVTFYPFGWDGKPVHAKIVYLDLVESFVEVMVIDKKPRVQLSMPYKIFVAPPSLNVRSRHRVLTSIMSRNLQSVIFPEDPKHMISVRDYARQEAEDLETIEFSSARKFNLYQKKAIIGILRAQHRIPYLLFGPPGTGKTTTLVEAVVLLLKADQSNRILVCTPSNTAADLFTLALLETKCVPESVILRMFSLGKSVEEQNPKLKNVVCAVHEDGMRSFGIEPKEELERKYRVILSTLSASSYLVSGDLQGSFSHIIIDEAGQADELDTLIPIVGLATETTSVILAGDPQQLGPVESCEFLKPFDLNTSLLERFMKKGWYENDRRLVTMLRDNYRSHNSLVEMPSSLFYKGMLIAAASGKDTLCNWAGLPTKHVPIVFHSVAHAEEFEVDGFSCRNLKEVEVVQSYVTRILSETDVLPREIGIISPYKYQVKTLRDRFARLPEMTVDSVERFQGSERRAIIVSTVRGMGLGFLDCDKRLNTTVTRAKELMVIVGNHVNLSQNRSWRKMIDYYSSKGVLIGDVERPLTVVQKKLTRRTAQKGLPLNDSMEVDDDFMTIDESSSSILSSLSGLGIGLEALRLGERVRDHDRRCPVNQVMNGVNLESAGRNAATPRIERGTSSMTGRDSGRPNSSLIATSTNDESMTSCCASDSFNLQFEEIMKNLKKM